MKIQVFAAMFLLASPAFSELIDKSEIDDFTGMQTVSIELISDNGFGKIILSSYVYPTEGAFKRDLTLSIVSENSLLPMDVVSRFDNEAPEINQFSMTGLIILPKDRAVFLKRLGKAKYFRLWIGIDKFAFNLEGLAELITKYRSYLLDGKL